MNKSLYTFSYTLITSASAGITYSALYLLVSSQKQACRFYFRDMDSNENIGFTGRCVWLQMLDIWIGVDGKAFFDYFRPRNL